MESLDPLTVWRTYPLVGASVLLQCCLSTLAIALSASGRIHPGFGIAACACLVCWSSSLALNFTRTPA